MITEQQLIDIFKDVVSDTFNIIDSSIIMQTTNGFMIATRDNYEEYMAILNLEFDVDHKITNLSLRFKNTVETVDRNAAGVLIDLLSALTVNIIPGEGFESLKSFLSNNSYLIYKNLSKNILKDEEKKEEKEDIEVGMTRIHESQIPEELREILKEQARREVRRQKYDRVLNIFRVITLLSVCITQLIRLCVPSLKDPLFESFVTFAISYLIIKK